MKIVFSDRFIKHYEALAPDIQKLTDKKIKLLAQNLRHPSLRVKKMEGIADIWEASITMNYRLTFKIQNNELHLRVIGKHDEALRKP